MESYDRFRRKAVIGRVASEGLLLPQTGHSKRRTIEALSVTADRRRQCLGRPGLFRPFTWTGDE
jgi:hypothetical protein